MVELMGYLVELMGLLVARVTFNPVTIIGYLFISRERLWVFT